MTLAVDRLFKVALLIHSNRKCVNVIGQRDIFRRTINRAAVFASIRSIEMLLRRKTVFSYLAVNLCRASGKQAAKHVPGQRVGYIPFTNGVQQRKGPARAIPFYVRAPSISFEITPPTRTPVYRTHHIFTLPLPFPHRPKETERYNFPLLSFPPFFLSKEPLSSRESLKIAPRE